MSDLKTLTINGKTYDIRNKYLDVLNGTNDLSKVELSLGTSGQRLIDFQKSDGTATRLEIQDDALKTRTYSDGSWTTEHYWYNSEVATYPATTTYNGQTLSWQYRRLSHNLYEFWVNEINLGNVTYNQWATYYYYYDFKNFYFPVTFSAKPMITLTGAGSQTIGVTYYWSTGDNNGKVTIRVLGTTSGAKDSYVNVHLLGTI